MPLSPSPDPVWIVGPVTWDEVLAPGATAPTRVPGGTALYIARTCESLDVQAHVLALGGPDVSLDALAVHETARVDTDTLTLRHEFPDGERGQLLLQAPRRTLTPADIPADWPEPATLILAPLLQDDVDVVAFIDEYPTAEVALLAQGLQRAVLPDHHIAHRAQPSALLMDAARPNVSIFLAEEETQLWPAGALDHLAARSTRVVVTQGARGARLITRRGEHHIASAPAQTVDATGAGDVFAAAFILAVRAGEEFAGRLAAAYAAAACEVHGPGVLPSLNEIEARFRLRAGADEGRPA